MYVFQVLRQRNDLGVIIGIQGDLAKVHQHIAVFILYVFERKIDDLPVVKGRAALVRHGLPQVLLRLQLDHAAVDVSDLDKVRRVADVLLPETYADIVGNDHVLILADLPQEVGQLQIRGGVAGRIALRSRALEHDFGRDRVVVRHARAGDVVQIDDHAVAQGGETFAFIMDEALAAYFGLVPLQIVESHRLIQAVAPSRAAREQDLLCLDFRVPCKDISRVQKIVGSCLLIHIRIAEQSTASKQNRQRGNDQLSLSAHIQHFLSTVMSSSNHRYGDAV